MGDYVAVLFKEKDAWFIDKVLRAEPDEKKWPVHTVIFQDYEDKGEHQR